MHTLTALALTTATATLAVFTSDGPFQLISPDPMPGSNFGARLVMEGDRFVTSDEHASLGAAAYVYDLIDGGVATLTPASASPSILYGTEFDLSGDTVVVSDVFYTDVALEQGAVFVFTKNAGTWSEEMVLTAPSPGTGHRFGYGVAIDDDTILVGAPTADAGIGAAHVFTRTTGVWSHQGTIQPGDLVAGDFFGYAVDLDGDTAVIGAPGVSGAAGDAQGALYVYTRSAGVWTLQDKLFPSVPQAEAFVGLGALAVHGDTLVAGAPEQDTPAGVDAGIAFVFERVGTLWTEVGVLAPAGVSAGDRFANSVAIDGETLVIGSPFDGQAGPNAGAAYVFRRSEGVWTEGEKILPPLGVAGQILGVRVALSGDSLLLGAYFGCYRFMQTAAPGPAGADLNNDGVIDGADLAILLANWGAP